MSYGFPKNSGQAARPKGGGGMFFLIIIGVIGFMIFSRMGGAGNQPGAGTGSDTGGMTVDDIESASSRNDYGNTQQGSRAVGKEMPTTGREGAATDWSMDDVATKKSENDFQPAGNRDSKTTNSKTQNGDWAMEDVDSKPKSGGNFQFSKQTEKGTANKSSNDWNMEDVDTKQNKAKEKTTNGDWSFEEVGEKKKK